MLSDMLQNAAEFPSETWEDEMFLRHLELTENAEYFEEEINWQKATGDSTYRVNLGWLLTTARINVTKTPEF